jgi:hypothetical protein
MPLCYREAPVLLPPLRGFRPPPPISRNCTIARTASGGGTKSNRAHLFRHPPPGERSNTFRIEYRICLPSMLPLTALWSSVLQCW